MAEILYCLQPGCHSRATVTIDYGSEVVGICLRHREILLAFFPTSAQRMSAHEGIFQIPPGWKKIVQRKPVRSADGVSASVLAGARIPSVVGRVRE